MSTQSDPVAPTTAVGYLNVSEAYRAAAQLLARELTNVGGWAGMPTRYCYYHAIENALKAALVAAGRTDTQLRAIGHRFADLVVECNALGYGMTEPSDILVLEMIDAASNYARARYHRKGAFRVATIQALDLTAHEAAELTVQFLRARGLSVRTARLGLPIEFKFQVM